jgi:hypothetical protein
MNLYKVIRSYLLRVRSRIGRISRRQWIEIAGVTALFTVLSIAYTNFIAIRGINHLIFTQGPGDATSGILWTDFANHTLTLFPGHTSIVNYPTGESMSNPAYLTAILLWIPVRTLAYLFGAVAGLNLMTLGGYILTALSAYWLVKRLTKSFSVALFAGYALAFFPYAIAKGTAHLAYIFNIFFVAILAAFMGLWLRPTKLRAVLLAVSIAASYYFDGYFILLATVMAGALVLGGFVYGYLAKYNSQDYLKRVRMLLLSALCLGVLVLPIMGVKVILGSEVNNALNASRSNIGVEIPFYRSWIIDFLSPATSNPFFRDSQNYQSVQAYRNTRSDALSNTSYIGYINIVLFVTGLVLLATWAFLRRHSSLRTVDQRAKSMYALLAVGAVISIVFFLSFMFSPAVNIFGMSVPLPAEVFIKYNINLWRNMSRFSGPIQVMVVVFAAMTLWMIFRTSKLLERLGGARKYAELFIVVVLCGLMAIEYANAQNIPSFDLNKQENGYYWLKSQQNIKVVAELPVSDPLDGISQRYTTMQIVHGKKLVNIKDSRYRTLSNVLGSIENKETIDWAYQRGAQAIITHGIGCQKVDWSLVQDRHVIASGKVGKDPSQIEGTVDTNKAIYLKLDRSNKGNDLLLQNIVVTARD